MMERSRLRASSRASLSDNPELFLASMTTARAVSTRFFKISARSLASEWASLTTCIVPLRFAGVSSARTSVVIFPIAAGCPLSTRLLVRSLATMLTFEGPLAALPISSGASCSSSTTMSSTQASWRWYISTVDVSATSIRLIMSR